MFPNVSDKNHDQLSYATGRAFPLTTITVKALGAPGSSAMPDSVLQKQLQAKKVYRQARPVDRTMLHTTRKGNE